MILFKNDPLDKLKISSKFGPRVRNGNTFHNGIDFSVPSNTPLKAVDDGEVMVSRVHPKGISAGMGIYMVIQYNGFCTVYGHLKRLGFPVGTKVKAGQIIGYSGNTGDTTGAHLHFEVRQGKFDQTFWNQIDGKYLNAIDPEPFLSINEKDFVKVLKKSDVDVELWVKGIEKNDPKIIKWIPELILKINNKTAQ